MFGRDFLRHFCFGEDFLNLDWFWWDFHSFLEDFLRIFSTWVFDGFVWRDFPRLLAVGGEDFLNLWDFLRFGLFRRGFSQILSLSLERFSKLGLVLVMFWRGFS